MTNVKAKTPRISRRDGALNMADLCNSLEKACLKVGREDLARMASEANALAQNAANDFEAAEITDRHLRLVASGEVNLIQGWTNNRAWALRSAGGRKRKLADALYEKILAALKEIGIEKQ